MKSMENDFPLHVLEYKVLCWKEKIYCARPIVVIWNSKHSFRSVQALFNLFLVCQMKRFLPRNVGSVMLEESID